MNENGRESTGGTALVQRLLDDRSHHIEFNGHLTNHVKHAVVALAGLGTPPERIKRYHDTYARLTPYGYGLEPARGSRHTITESTWQEHLGQRTSFSAYCDFFDRQERDLGMAEVLNRYLPLLLPGWVGAFTHATIHVGWALDAGSRWMTVEGLAYMAFSSVDCHPERMSPDTADSAGETPVDSLLRFAGAWEGGSPGLPERVRKVLDDTSPEAVAGMPAELLRSGLQYRIARMLREGDPLVYRTPAWAADQPSATSWEQLYYAVTLLYLARPGDFVLLHLITSLHAMEQISLRLPEERRRWVVALYWTGLLCIVLSEGGFPARAKLAALHRAFKDSSDGPGDPLAERDWAHLVARAVEEEEEHNPKLVYVLRRVWDRTGGVSLFRAAAGQFTTTPELPPSFEEPPAE
ncbi:questin oxidase family protein [Streptomyces sp. NPDC001985]|uniref:questin oxidase family protein n=1 Tax=Streptomyces sp. NPDC001985 TaxID=3154406 RepID=UPI00331B6429